MASRPARAAPRTDPFIPSGECFSKPRAGIPQNAVAHEDCNTVSGVFPHQHLGRAVPQIGLQGRWPVLARARTNDSTPRPGLEQRCGRFARTVS